jgi:NADH-quinone oxidoreductase subunit L
MAQTVLLILLAPLAGFTLLVLFGKRLGEPWAGWLATAATGISFLASVAALVQLLSIDERRFEHSYFSWLPAGILDVDASVLVDPLAITIVLFVTGVSALIHLFSIGYMHGDEKFDKFFLYLNLFVFSMLVLVLGGNLLMTFLGWEGVGTCSYLLISFWFTKEANAVAGKKAFITNRVGDWGFLVAMFLAFVTFGTLDYAEILPAAGMAGRTAVTVIALMLFVGAVGKSAQIPLYIWLPDAMAGPTPVSALIHAATMVTAGVYLMCRVSPLLAAGEPWVLTMIAWVGAATALLAATIASAQMDIKKVLAYSTVSQIGFLFLAVGLGAYWVAVFHMVTHAFFKACLFLGSGSVIHGMHNEQDLRRMGGLRRYMPITSLTFIVAWLAIIGVPPLSGFWSKDEILAYALHKSPVLYGVGLVAALLTGYYMTRCVIRTFSGDENWKVVPAPSSEDESLAAALANAEPEARSAALAQVPDLHLRFDPEPPHSTHLAPDHEPHESPWTMTTPLIILGVLSAFGGFLSIPFGGLQFLEHWLEPSFELSSQTVIEHLTAQTILELGIGTVIALAGAGAAWFVWGRPAAVAAAPQQASQPALFGNAWYYDIAVSRFMGGPGRVLFDALAWFDRVVIDGLVNVVGTGSVAVAAVLRKGQTGFVRRYAFGVGLGSVLLLGFVVAKVLGA